MIRVTWEWLGQAPALDLANTVAVVDGEEHDLIGSSEDYAGWARSEAKLVPQGSCQLLLQARRALMDLRAAVRDLLAAVAMADRPEAALTKELNRVSRSAPGWLELDAGVPLALREKSLGNAVDGLLAHYARSAMKVAVHDASHLRRCPAPSCGMFYTSSRRAQRWCSTQCGTRARVARHYNSRRRTLAS
jgi:predicted RNA-binding Zn ribbon-like protein